MTAFLGLLLLFAIGLAVAGVSMLLSPLVTIARPNPVKLEPYECGIPSDGSKLVQVPVKFYLVCLLFLIFDVEVIFVLTWALVFHEAPWYGAAVMAPFMAFLVVGLVYEWKRGALKWQ